MGLWDVHVHLGAEIDGAVSDCLRSRLGVNAIVPETGYGEPPDYRALGLTLYRVEASSEGEAGNVALDTVRAAAADCNAAVEPVVTAVRPNQGFGSAAQPPHRAPRRSAVAIDPGAPAVAAAVAKLKRKRKRK